jgi:hypothetical protein
MTDNLRFQIFGAVWILLGLLSAWVYKINRDVNLKRAFFRKSIWALPILFCFFICFISWSLWPLPLVVPFCGVFVWLAIRYPPRFCETCGTRVGGLGIFPAEFCGKCGTPIVPGPEKS